MALLKFLSLTCCYAFLHLQQAVAAPPPLIEAYKPTTGVTTTLLDVNSGVGAFRKLRKILSNLQHKIDDINERRKFMEAQMKSPYAFLPSRMEAALDYTNMLTPSFSYFKTKIVSANGVFLQIFPDGTANGTRDDTSPYADITVEMVGVSSTVRILIKGAKSQKYLTCSKNGKFQASTGNVRTLPHDSLLVGSNRYQGLYIIEETAHQCVQLTQSTKTFSQKTQITWTLDVEEICEPAMCSVLMATRISSQRHVKEREALS